jgi:hypothetical protein
MSLINDALKRAKNAQQKNTPASGMRPMRPVEPMRPIEPKRAKRDYKWILPVVVVLLIVVAVFFIALSVTNHAVKTFIAAPEIPPAPPVESVATPAPPEPPAVIGPAAINTSPPMPPPRIQGIAYGSAHPWAIINNKTVYVGDMVDGMRVTEIARSSVTLTGNGQTNKCFVGQ